MRTRRTATFQELRHTIDSLPLKTRVAMLGRAGRTNGDGFASTGDRLGGINGRRSRRAAQRELLILSTHLEMSLIADAESTPDLAAALAEHRQLVAENGRATNRDRGRAAHRERARAKRAIEAIRPGDPDRGRALRREAGSAWMRVFRRRDDYERALARIETRSVGRSDRHERQPA